MTNREIDIKIAEKVFGAKVTFLNQQHGWRIDYVTDKEECNDPIRTDWGNDGEKLKSYSTDLKAAWEVVEFFKDRIRFVLTMGEMPSKFYSNVVIHLGMGNFKEYQAEANTAPEAICLAILNSIEIET
jgi:hypothetical protein